jgi:hypothetical protein
LVVQPVHMLVAVLQIGFGGTHAAVLPPVHWTQAPIVGPAAVLQAGVVGRPLQSVSEVQGPQVFVDVLHTGAEAGQSLFATHATQVPVAVLHTGVGAEHWLLIVQPTHRFVFVLQWGVGAIHCVVFVAVHWTQAPIVGPAAVLHAACPG